MQSLQHSVLGCFQQTIEKSRISPTTTSAQPEPAAVSFTSEGDVQVTTEQERPTGGHHGRAPPPQHREAMPLPGGLSPSSSGEGLSRGSRGLPTPGSGGRSPPALSPSVREVNVSGRRAPMQQHSSQH